MSEINDRKISLLRSLESERESFNSRYELPYIVSVLMDYERDNNISRVSRKFKLDKKTVTAWVEKIKVIYAKQYKSKAQEIIKYDREVSSADLTEQEMILYQKRKDKLVLLGSTVEEAEKNLYDISVVESYNVINVLSQDLERLTATQQIQFLSALDKLKSNSTKISKELNQRLLKYAISRVTKKLVEFLERGQIVLAKDLTIEGLFMALDREIDIATNNNEK